MTAREISLKVGRSHAWIRAMSKEKKEFMFSFKEDRYESVLDYIKHIDELKEQLTELYFREDKPLKGMGLERTLFSSSSPIYIQLKTVLKLERILDGVLTDNADKVVSTKQNVDTHGDVRERAIL